MGCSIECYRLRIGSFSQKVPKVKTVGSRHNKVKLKKVECIFLSWCIIYLLVLLSSIHQEHYGRLTMNNPSIRQINISRPTKSTSAEVLDQNQVAFKNPYLVATKLLNKEIHTLNGNHSKRGKPIKICYWNKGSSFLINKTEDVKEIINTHKPLVLGLGEAQFKSNHELADVQQPGYTLHLDSCQASLGISRCAVYTHDSLVVKRRHDLETEGIATVWLQLGLPNQKGILVMCGYRQWRLPHQPDGGTASSTVPAQRQRWGLILDQ